MKTSRKSNSPKYTGPRTSSPKITSQTDPTARPEVSSPPKPQLSSGVRFKYVNSQAKDVRLAGSFNHWDTSANPLRKISEGLWETELNLPPGEYEYRYFVDGQWQDDPASTKTIQNPFGALNSVIQVPSPERS